MPKAKDEDEPWLQLIWKDDLGKLHQAEFALLYRTFARTLIHEHVFWYAGQHDVPRWTSPCCEYSSGFHYEDQLARFIRNGFPQPQRGGKMEGSRALSCGKELHEVLIFCDDLYLCPNCGTYYPDRSYLPSFEWLKRDRRIDHNLILELIERRRSVPEFYIQACMQGECAKIRARTLERMKEDDDAVARTRALNELLKRDPTTRTEFPIPRTARAAFVYAIKADVYVKIGVAADVKSRVLALRTGLPFEIVILNTWRHENATHIERLLHRRFKSSRCFGEWFRLTDSEIVLLQRTTTVEELVSDEIQHGKASES